MANVFRQRWRCFKCLTGKSVRTKASNAQSTSSRKSAVPLVPHANLKKDAPRRVRENRHFSLQTPIIEPTKPSSSAILSDHSSQTPVVQSDQLQEQTKTDSLVSDIDCICTISENAKLGLPGHVLLSDKKTMDVASGIYEAGFLHPFEHVNDSSPRLELSDPLYSSEPDYAELLKTPRQNCSQFELFADRHANGECGSENDGELSLGDQLPTGHIASLTVLCTTCQSQRVLAKNPSDTMQW